MSRLAHRIQEGRTAVLTMEIQRGIVGDLSGLVDLKSAVDASNLIQNTARLVRAARQAGVRVVHCTASFRPDRAGSFRTIPMVNAALKDPGYLLSGSPEAEIVPELGPEPQDLVDDRLHGVAPFTGTSLDALLRSDGIDTIIATGVSLNIGIIGLAIEAVGLGYHVVVASDCVVGFPIDYGEQLLRNSLAPIATLGSAEEIEAIWRAEA